MRLPVTPDYIVHDRLCYRQQCHNHSLLLCIPVYIYRSRFLWRRRLGIGQGLFLHDIQSDEYVAVYSSTYTRVVARYSQHRARGEETPDLRTNEITRRLGREWPRTRDTADCHTTGDVSCCTRGLTDGSEKTEWLQGWGVPVLRTGVATCHW